jgi:DNA repair protein RadC
MSQLTFLQVPTETRDPFTIRELPEAERPVNRIQRFGPAALSTYELIAILLGTNDQLATAGALMGEFGGIAGLAKANFAELTNHSGIGTATAARLKAAFELGRRLMIHRDEDRYQVRSPADAANLIMHDMGLLDQEHLVTVILDTKNRVLDIPTIYVGSVNTSLIRVGEVFRQAIRINAPSLIVAHNHPSGDPTPSPEDVAVTHQMVEAGKLMDIDVLDHLIIGRNKFVSLKERGLGF